jgi:hypothetical protein
MLAPLTSLVGECGHTKFTKRNRVTWNGDEVHQRAFDHVKATFAKEVVLGYPD